MPAKRVLVTGADGFTGRYVCDELRAKGCEVFGLTKDGSTKGDFIDLTQYEGVLHCVETVKPTAVIHLAAIAYVGHGDPSDFYKVNVIGTRNLLRALKEVGSVREKVILASSANIYGNRYGDRLLTEDLAPDPVNDYAVSKASMELMARLFANDFPLAIVRPFNYTGVGQSENFLVPKIVKAFREKASELHLGNLDVERDFSDVRDVARMYCALLYSPFVGAVNFCNGCKYKLMEVVGLCREISGHDLKIVSDAGLQRSSEVNSICGSAQKLTEVLGKRERFSFEETLRWMLQAG